MKKIVSVVGKKKSGKTKFIEKLIPELKKRGYRVGTIKHDVHGFEMDKEGKDTYRHFQAGADSVVISSKNKIGMVKKVDKEWEPDKIALTLLADVDIIITEGYKSLDKQKIEILPEGEIALLSKEEELLAVVSNKKLNLKIPTYNFLEIKKIADLLEGKL